VVFSKYGGTEIKIGSEDYLILREADVLAKVVSTGSKAGSKKKEKEMAETTA
jgi:Chaperonin 10 Kd subunit